MLTFRDLVRADIPTALALCRASRWNQVARDWEHFLRLSPGGCRGAEVDGRLVGTVTTVRYEPGFAWIGMVLVDPEFRGRGVGTALLEEALRLPRDVTTVWLDATPAGYGLYRKLGFEEDSRLVRMECTVPLMPMTGTSIEPLAAVDVVTSLDRRVFGGERAFHLEWMLEGCPRRAWMTAEMDGFVCARTGENFLHVGPLVAPDPATAATLLAASGSHAEGKPVIVDATTLHPEWLDRLSALGFREQRPFIRMRKGPAAGKLPHPFEFAILGPEFG